MGQRRGSGRTRTGPNVVCVVPQPEGPGGLRNLRKWGADGQIEFLGRLDQQVKIRGHRIEPGEIETWLGQHPAVGAAVVTAWGEAPGTQRLVAYVVPKMDPSRTGSGASRREVNEIGLNDYLKQHLPEYMVPSVFMWLDALPLTANGKIDRRALPAPLEARLTLLQEELIPPKTETKKAVARIWAEVLGLKQVSVRDNFFHLGGHSLLIMQVIARVREAFQIDLRMRCLFDCPTIAKLAITIEEILWRDINEIPENVADSLAAEQTGGRDGVSSG